MGNSKSVASKPSAKELEEDVRLLLEYAEREKEREKEIENRKTRAQRLGERTGRMLADQLPWFLPTASAIATYALPPHISTPLLIAAYLTSSTDDMPRTLRGIFLETFKGIIPMLILKAGIATFASPATSSVLDFVFTKTVSSPYAQGAAYGFGALAFIHRFNKITLRWAY